MPSTKQSKSTKEPKSAKSTAHKYHLYFIASLEVSNGEVTTNKTLRFGFTKNKKKQKTLNRYKGCVMMGFYPTPINLESAVKALVKKHGLGIPENKFVAASRCREMMLLTPNSQEKLAARQDASPRTYVKHLDQVFRDCSLSKTSVARKLVF